MPTTPTLRRIPQCRVLDDGFTAVFDTIAAAVRDGDVDQETAAGLLVKAIQPWMQTFAVRLYTKKAGHGSQVGSNADNTISEVSLAVWRAAQKMRWDSGVDMARRYLTRVAAMAVSQAGREDDDMERRHRSYLKHSMIVAERWATEKGAPLTGQERRDAILWALENEVPVWLRPAKSNYDEFADMVERYWHGPRQTILKDTSGDDRVNPNDIWDRPRSDDTHDTSAEDAVQNDETAFLFRVMRTWTDVMTPEHRDMVLDWLDEQHSWGSTSRTSPPAQMLRKLETYVPQLIGLIAQEDADAASAALSALADKTMSRNGNGSKAA